MVPIAKSESVSKLISTWVRLCDVYTTNIYDDNDPVNNSKQTIGNGWQTPISLNITHCMHLSRMVSKFIFICRYLLYFSLSLCYISCIISVVLLQNSNSLK
jgi:hypothetical protein